MEGRKEHNQAQSETFDRLVQAFEAPLRPEVQDRLKEIVAQAEIREGQVVLDVGTGVGALIPLISRYKPSRILACDLSPGMLARVAHKYPEVETFQADVIDLELPRAGLDAAFLNGMFSNIFDKSAALKKLAFLLRPGGRMVVSHPEGSGFIRRLKEKVRFRLDLLPPEPEWEELLALFPFESVHFQDDPGLYLAMARRTDDQPASGKLNPAPSATT